MSALTPKVDIGRISVDLARLMRLVVIIPRRRPTRAAPIPQLSLFARQCRGVFFRRGHDVMAAADRMALPPMRRQHRAVIVRHEGGTGRGIDDVVPAIFRMIDLVLAARAGAALQTDQLMPQARMLDQPHHARVQQRQER